MFFGRPFLLKYKTVGTLNLNRGGRLKGPYNMSMSMVTGNKVRPHAHKPLNDLINSYLVFQLCRFPLLIQSSMAIISTFEKLGLSRPLYWGIKSTFFKHFCGGENLKEVVPT